MDLVPVRPGIAVSIFDSRSQRIPSSLNARTEPADDGVGGVRCTKSGGIISMIFYGGKQCSKEKCTDVVGFKLDTSMPWDTFGLGKKKWHCIQGALCEADGSTIKKHVRN